MTDQEIPIVIDVSRWSGRVKWRVVKGEGVLGVYNRTTLGDWYADPTFDRNVALLKSEGFDQGGYHVLNFKQDIKYQAELFGANLGVTNLVPVVDCERYQWLQRSRNSDALEEFIGQAHKETGQECMIYTRGYWFDRWIGQLVDWARYRLWVAHYNNRIEHPRIPKAWELYTLWQYSQTGRVKGIPSATDLNRFGTDPRGILQ